jgi:hypothetical protein
MPKGLIQWQEKHATLQKRVDSMAYIKTSVYKEKIDLVKNW